MIAARFLLLLCSCISLGAWAEDLPDPTRPPAAILSPDTYQADGGAQEGLHSVIISKHRRAAIIDGQTVELGGKVGDARLIRVEETSVVLRGPDGRERLLLFPDVKKLDRKARHHTQPPQVKKNVSSGSPAAAAEHREAK